MPFESKSVQFQIPSVNHGLQMARGLLKLVGEELVFEFRITDAVLEIFSSDVKEVRVRLADLEAVELRRGWIRTKLVLEAKSLRVFRDLPGTRQAECVLKISRKERKDAEALASKIRLAISELILKDLDEEP